MFVFMRIGFASLGNPNTSSKAASCSMVHDSLYGDWISFKEPGLTLTGAQGPFLIGPSLQVSSLWSDVPSLFTLVT